MTLPKRLSVKFFATEDSEIDLPNTFNVFQQWIQDKTVEGLLIDVVDYKHAPSRSRRNPHRRRRGLWARPCRRKTRIALYTQTPH